MNGETKMCTMLDKRYEEDFDGFLTELSIWEETDMETGEVMYFIVVGDLDLYGPVEGEDFDMSYADWTEENREAAMEFYEDWGSEE